MPRVFILDYLTVHSMASTHLSQCTSHFALHRQWAAPCPHPEPKLFDSLAFAMPTHPCCKLTKISNPISKSFSPQKFSCSSQPKWSPKACFYFYYPSYHIPSDVTITCKLFPVLLRTQTICLHHLPPLPTALLLKVWSLGQEPRIIWGLPVMQNLGLPLRPAESDLHFNEILCTWSSSL